MTTTFHLTARAVGKTHYLIDKMYTEADHVLVVPDFVRGRSAIDRLVDRCLEEGTPPWYDGEVYGGTLRGFWTRFWEQRVVTPDRYHKVRGLQRYTVLIDDVGDVLRVLFGDVEAATGTEDVKRYVPTQWQVSSGTVEADGTT